MYKVMSLIPLSIFVFLLALFSSSAYATADDATVGLSLDEAISLSAPSTITITGCNPSTSNLCTVNANVTITSNVAFGYKLYMNAASGSSNSLTNPATSPAATIPTLSTAYASGSFPTNYWGYTGGLDKSGETGGLNCSANYCPILAYESDPEDYSPNRLIDSGDGPVASKTTTLTFASKIDTTKPSGTYSTSILFTAVGNPIVYTQLTDSMNMQDVDRDICGNTPLYSTSNKTYTIIDSRDGTEYTVAKLADGNCWMTQNLALGGDTAMNLTQADSNVGPSGFTLPASVTEGDWSYSTTTPEFFDYAGNYPSQQATNKYGNYYNWPAAAAGSTNNVNGGNAQYDICPKGWRLPIISSDNFSGSEFYIMINNYITTGTWDDYYWTNVNFSQLTSAPISLTLSGSYFEGLEWQGSDSYWWASTAYDSDLAFYLDASSNVDPHVFTDKYSGFSVRCLMPGP